MKTNIENIDYQWVIELTDVLTKDLPLILEKYKKGVSVCVNCDGTGATDVFENCGKPSSICCGGCYESEECQLCDGLGEHEISQLIINFK